MFAGYGNVPPAPAAAIPCRSAASRSFAGRGRGSRRRPDRRQPRYHAGRTECRLERAGGSQYHRQRQGCRRHLQFTRADGSNINIEEVVTGAVTGGIGHASTATNDGSNVTIASSITLASGNASPIVIAGSNPAAAGLTAGTVGSYMDANFTQDATQATGSVVIDSTNNTLQGIRDAINNAGLGVTASIVSDGSDKPFHLVLSSTKTGASSAMKISLSGSDGQPADSALNDLLAYDVGGTQNLKQNSAAQNTMFSVNGIPITSNSNSVDTAIEGVTLITKIGSSSLSVAKDTSTVKNQYQCLRQGV
jgi:flagellar hook-associated protein 2